MNIKYLYSMLLLIQGIVFQTLEGFQTAERMIYVVPVAYDEGTGAWMVLFRLPPRINQWHTFSVPKVSNKKKELIPQALEPNLYRQLRIETVQDKNIQTVTSPLGEIYIVEVPFIRGRELYNQLIGTKKVNHRDLRWVSITDITYGKSRQPHKEKGVEEKLPVSMEIVHQDAVLKILAEYSSGRKKISEKPMMQPAVCTWNTIQPSILFYNRGEPFYEFANFYEGRPVYIDGTTWPTTEHYYQAQKFRNVQDQRLFESDQKNPLQGRVYKTARDARDAGQIRGSRSLQAPRLSQDEWQAESLYVMIKAVRAKFSQHDDLKYPLLGTGNVILVENAGANDDFFGNGADGTGKNHLGQILMHVREELFAQNYQKYPKHVPLLPRVYDAMLFEKKYTPYESHDACWFELRLKDSLSDDPRILQPVVQPSIVQPQIQQLPVQKSDEFAVLLGSLQALLEELDQQLCEQEEPGSLCLIQ